MGGVLAGLALFLWESVAHMMLPLGEMGFSAVPDEPASATVLKQHFKQQGLYIFSTPPPAKGAPAGILVVHPQGMDELTPRQLSTQLLADILVMIAAGWVLSKAAGSLGGYFARTGFVTALAAFPILRAHVPYWNRYSFPLSYTLAESITHIVGFLVGGLVLARLVTASKS